LRKDTAPGVPANAFLFDFHLSEGTGGSSPLMGLRELKIWVKPQSDLNYAALSAFGTPVCDLGGLLNSVMLTDGVAAPGEPDAEFRLPADAIRNVAGIQSSDYVYLHVQFSAAEPTASSPFCSCPETSARSQPVHPVLFMPKAIP